MSLCIAWVRKNKDMEELCMIADSCFSGGQRFLAAPKIFPLSRNDCAIACAGATSYSFPVVEHIMKAVELNQKFRDRACDVAEFRHSILDITNKCLIEEQEPEFVDDGPDFSMIFAGYSWRLKKFCLWEIHYDKYQKKMNYTTPSTIKRVPFAVIGDMVSKVRHLLYQRLEADGVKDRGFVDMQPLDVLIQMIDDTDANTRSIGGYPQMVKIYPFMRVLPIGFRQTKNDKNIISYCGRPLLDYEIFPYPIYDLEEKKIRYMKEVSEEFERKSEDISPLRFKVEKNSSSAEE